MFKGLKNLFDILRLGLFFVVVAACVVASITGLHPRAAIFLILAYIITLGAIGYRVQTSRVGLSNRTNLANFLIGVFVLPALYFWLFEASFAQKLFDVFVNYIPFMAVGVGWRIAQERYFPEINVNELLMGTDDPPTPSPYASVFFVG